eukprot:gene3998-7968_t
MIASTIQGISGYKIRTFSKLNLNHLRMMATSKSEPSVDKDRPFTLPPGEFRPKQSLGQNFLSDQNYVNKIVNALSDSSEGGHKVIELGPGAGALSRVLFPKYPRMKLPGLTVIHQDVLKTDWPALAAERGGPLSVIGNLPFYITSQILFSLADSHKAVQQAVVTMQYEVAERVVAKPSTKAYGILSVVFQLYSAPSMNFKIPPSVFFPQPKVESALVTFNFRKQHPLLHTVKPLHLRRILLASFQKRRKMLRQSLKDLLLLEGLTMPEKWSTMRPEQLKPEEFLQLTADIFGKQDIASASNTAGAGIEGGVGGVDASRLGYVSDIVWRKALHKQIVIPGETDEEYEEGGGDDNNEEEE